MPDWEKTLQSQGWHQSQMGKWCLDLVFHQPWHTAEGHHPLCSHAKWACQACKLDHFGGSEMYVSREWTTKGTVSGGCINPDLYKEPSPISSAPRCDPKWGLDRKVTAGWPSLTIGLPGMGEDTWQTGKVKAWSMIGEDVIVGYANSGYQLYNWSSHSITTSHDVIFKEGTGYCFLTVLEEPKENIPLTTGNLPDANIYCHNRHYTGMTASGTQDQVWWCANPPWVWLCPCKQPNCYVRNAWKVKPTRSTPIKIILNGTTLALLAARETLQREQEAQDQGED